MQQEADFVAFVTRYNHLKTIWFSQKAMPQYDDDGKEMPSAYDRKSLMVMFENMGLMPPASRTDAPRFLNPSNQQGFDAWRQQWEAENKVKLF